MEFMVKNIDGDFIAPLNIQNLSEMVPSIADASLVPSDDILRMSFKGARFYFSYEDTFYHVALEDGSTTETEALEFVEAFAEKLASLSGQRFEVIEI